MNRTEKFLAFGLTAFTLSSCNEMDYQVLEYNGNNIIDMHQTVGGIDSSGHYYEFTDVKGQHHSIPISEDVIFVECDDCTDSTSSKVTFLPRIQ
jgi:hypothetical protein